MTDGIDLDQFSHIPERRIHRSLPEIHGDNVAVHYGARFSPGIRTAEPVQIGVAAGHPLADIDLPAFESLIEE